ncbi:CYTH domain-containing protein [Candidatus Woesearchaeota archaeon]|nr:CYTH domain-containing protein [Candidatus Woesearchaeota archaeon]
MPHSILKKTKREYQLKLKAHVHEERLIAMGARKLGSVIQEDVYYVPKGESVRRVKELVRIRKEGSENFLFTYKGPVANRRIRTRLVVHKSAKEKEIETIMHGYEEVLRVNKQRTLFFIDSVIINLDHVENIGKFIEFELASEKEYYKIKHLMKLLKNLHPHQATRLSYFEIALRARSPFHHFLGKLHEHFGRYSFGISSAVLTTIGIIVGVNAATTSALAVMGGIASVAIADSMSDAMGMYASKKAERGLSKTIAVWSAFNVFISKLIFTSTFMIPFLFAPLSTAILICIAWGMILISFVSVIIAFINEESIPYSIMKNVMITIIVIGASFAAGKAIEALF